VADFVNMVMNFLVPQKAVNFLTSHAYCLLVSRHGLSILLFIPNIYECGQPRWNDIDRGKPKNSKESQSQYFSRLWGPPSLLYNGYRGSYPRGKARPGRDADHSPPSSAEVENE
jgi:hypothetical protein